MSGVGVLHSAQEYVLYTTAACILVGGNRVVPGGNTRPSIGCYQTFLFTTTEEAYMT